MAIKARIATYSGVQAKVAVAPPVEQSTTILNLADVDATQLADGAVMIYNAALEKFVIKPTMDNANTKIIGGSF